MKQEPLFSFYTSTLYHTLYKACANALAIGAYRLAPSRPSINHKLMNLCNKQYEQSKADKKDTRSSARRYGSELATWPVYERLSTWRRAICPLFSTVNGKKLLSRVPFSVSPILGDRTPAMLNSFIVVSVLKMKCFVVMSVLLMLLYTMKNRGQKLASYSHTFYSQSAEGVALLYSASSFKNGRS